MGGPMSQMRNPASGQAKSAIARSGDVSRAVIAGLALVGLFGIAYAIAVGAHMPRDNVQARSQSDDNLTTGSIVYMPALGDTCRKRIIDNRTGQVRDLGPVPCSEALNPTVRGSAGGPPTRIDIIRESFRRSAP
jgi:hypothetical protein